MISFHLFFHFTLSLSDIQDKKICSLGFSCPVAADFFIVLLIFLFSDSITFILRHFLMPVILRRAGPTSLTPSSPKISFFLASSFSSSLTFAILATVSLSFRLMSLTPDAVRPPSEHGVSGAQHTDDDSVCVYDHDLIVLVNCLDSDDISCLFGDLVALYTPLPPRFCAGKFMDDQCTFTHTFFRYDQKVHVPGSTSCIPITSSRSARFIPMHSHGVTACCSYVGLIKADTLTILRC